MKDIYKHIDDNVDEYIKDLQEFIRKPSVSAQKLGLEECANYVVEKMHKDGLPAELHEIPDGPPLVFGHLKSSNSKGPFSIELNVERGKVSGKIGVPDLVTSL